MIPKFMFCCFLAAAAAQDIRRRTISGRLLLAGALLGLPWALGALTAEGILPFLAGFLPGLLMLGLSGVTKGAVGTGDGLFFLAAALYLRPGEVFGLFFGGLLICGIFCGGLMVGRILLGYGYRNCSVPFLPFLLPVFGAFLAFGGR